MPSSPRSRDWRSIARYTAMLIAMHVGTALSIGVIRSCGVFYLSWQQEFDTTASQTAAIQSIMSATNCFTGVIAGLLTQRFGCRFTGMLGGILATCGLLFGFWATGIGLMYLMATVLGIGTGIAYIATMSAVALYFTKRYKLANSVATSGVGMGGMSVPPLVQILLDRYGQRGAILVTSGVMAHLIMCAALFRSPTGQDRSRLKPQPLKVYTALTSEIHGELSSDDERNGVQPLENPRCIPKEDGIDNIEVSGKNTVDREAATGVENGQVESNLPAGATRRSWIVGLLERFSRLVGLNVIYKKYRFLLLAVLFFGLMTNVISFAVFIVPFARSRDVPPSSAAFLLTFVGIGSLIGRLAQGPLISWKVPELLAFAICFSLAGVSAILATVDLDAVQVVASCIQGLSTGAAIGISLALTRQFVGSENFALCLGWCVSFSGIGIFFGPVVLGRVLDLTGSYSTVFYVMAAIYFFCSLLVAIFPSLNRLELRQQQGQ